MSPTRRWLAPLPVLLLVACAQGDPYVGGTDVGPIVPGDDSGPHGTDSATPRVDGGPGGVDAGPGEVDGGPTGVDSGPTGTDSGPMGRDAGGYDAGDPCLGVDCSSMDDRCHTGVCDRGDCRADLRPDGTACDLACTTGATCSLGTCRGGTPMDCSTLDGPCAHGGCDMAVGHCTATPAADGTSCDTTPGDCTADACLAGSCALRAAADCMTCGGTNVCSAGTCGAPPAMLSYDFESGMPASWTTDSGTGWVVATSMAHGGTHAARSGTIGASGRSSLRATVTVSISAALTFWVSTSTESCCDHLELYVDGAMQGQWSGTTAWTQASASLAPGAHMVEWRYQKDGSVSSGSDAVWIDDVAIGPAPALEGFEATSLPGGWTTGGNASWITDTAQHHSGARAAASGDISDSQTSTLTHAITLGSAVTIGFWLMTSSESSYDKLTFTVDGMELGSWSGATAWTHPTYPLTAGAHTLVWAYSKDGSVSSGSDRVWLDDVDLAVPPVSGPICGT